MKLIAKDFRRLPENFSDKIRDMGLSPLILVKADGLIMWGKDDVLRAYSEKDGDIVLFSWNGNYRTDMFIVTAADLKKHYFGEYSATSKIPAKKAKQLQELQELVDSL